MNKEPGYCKGEICGRGYGCVGIIEEHDREGCSCHINPPCPSCTAPVSYCETCGWEEADDESINDYIVNVDKKTGNYKTWTKRPLDKTKIDWYDFSHTNASMLKRGIYPEGTTIKEVRKKVDGTFGGRFNYFDNGKFEFIAYTD